MRFFIIDEFGLKTKDEKGIIRAVNIQKVEIPDKLLEEFKTAYELWLEEQKQKGEVNNES